ncbi:Protein of unknown function DUF2148 [Methanosalsum zhilinae DSM 4017]|uniref:4Fe-4S domain-containing protein n=1 Tax=Methanosalsum zhilinae (strain DSM 4017 / NBRC 107636 / OCM 62 / WeN5) TaxID=679901 RepID=F7XK93_METZD|nr:DUF2148 domain-containing protein [Methanosalsum zhilinae]AEH60558.1 Protein of unknown function DUF2148 [Methanosalsum zhilinae DSM 4017]
MKLNPENNDIETFAKMILTAARTSPKARGIDDILTGIVEDDEIGTLADTMGRIADKKGKGFEFFKRDSGNIREADAVILIGLKECESSSLDCSGCGYATCQEMLNAGKVESDYRGPNCSIKYIDLGIAVGAAVSKAKDLCIDNRVMYTAGAAARAAGLMDADMIYGIPLNISGKNIFFDRK